VFAKFSTFDLQTDSKPRIRRGLHQSILLDRVRLGDLDAVSSRVLEQTTRVARQLLGGELLGRFRQQENETENAVTHRRINQSEVRAEPLVCQVQVDKPCATPVVVLHSTIRCTRP